MKRYDAIIIGTGSAMNLVEPMIQENPKIKIAVIDKDEPGGICLTRGCIPSKILLYPAELVRTIQEASEFGLVVNMGRPDFPKVMARMRSLIDGDIDSIRQGLSNSDNIDYFPSVAEFTAPYVLKVAGETITSDMILLCTGSRAVIPPIDGLEGSGYITSDTALHLNQLPESLVIVGGGYIAAEFGHFFSAMGSKVTVVGRNARFIPEQEPEVSALAKEVLGKYMTIVTNHEVRRVEKTLEGKRVYAVNRADGKELVLESKEVMIASGRGPTSDILHPERGGIKTTKDGWLEVDEYLQTSMRNVWAFGDADGRYLFKHVANYESQLVYYNAVLKRKVTVDYHAVPSAVFTYPEIARVGLGEKEAIEAYGEMQFS
ncbi:MAG TPA: dihydrolipoyl dehydrogenase [Nitrososphaerales archaeon]|nr:dihydrolipoyl dehydrogenase [Nitrososphaerales archaeon]